MSYKQLFDTGEVCLHFPESGEDLIFETATVLMDWTKELTQITTSSGLICSKFLGYRANISIDIFNFCDNDFTNILTLLEYIREHTNRDSTDLPFYIIPRSNNVTGSQYYCNLVTKDIEFGDVDENDNTGQTLTLEFETAGRVAKIPIYSTLAEAILMFVEGGVEEELQVSKNYQVESIRILEEEETV